MSFSKKIKNNLLNKSDAFNYYKENYDKLNENQKVLEKRIKYLEKSLNDKDNLVKFYKKPFNDFDGYLVKSYNNPFIKSPFSEEEKRCLVLMENVADFLSSISQNCNNKPLISVIMPVYNREDVVMNAIDSVLNQTYDNFELIVVDDASTDGTASLLDKITDERVTVIHHEENKYPSGARNTGLKMSNGELIAYLDSDNLLEERYLAATVGAFLHLPDAAAIYSAQYRYTTYDSKPVSVQFCSFNKSLIHNHNYIDLNCFSHRRCVLEKIKGFDSNLKGAEDWDLVLQISNNYKIYSVPFLLSRYYIGVSDNRISDSIVPTKMQIRENNEKLPKNEFKLNKKVSIIIPVFESLFNLDKCINAISSLDSDNVEIIVSNNNPNIDLNDKFDANEIKLVENYDDKGFTHALTQGINGSDPNSDILILNQEAILTEGTLELMQHQAYEISDCGMVVSTQIIENGSKITSHVTYALDDYWCDITPSRFYNNILKVPIFHDGELLELKQSPFFCSYIKRDVYKKTNGFDPKFSKHYHSMSMFSYYIRHLLGLKIIHVADAIVIRNASEEFKNTKPINEYDYNFHKNQLDSDEMKYIWDF